MNRRVPKPLVIAAAVALAGAGVWVGLARPWQSDRVLSLIGPTDPVVGAAEQVRRPDDAAVRDVTLTAAPATIDLGDRTVETWAFNGTVPGPEIRLRAGDVLRARVRNDLPDPLTIHWHGIALRNDMDGVPGVTQEPIEPGAEFVYEAWDAEIGLWGVTGSGDVERSEDGGRSWTSVGSLPGEPPALLADGDTLYAAAMAGEITGIYRSTDGGQTWPLVYRDNA